MKFAAILIFAALLVSQGPLTADAQDAFSCSWGKRAACLDYGDQVCSQMGKCVDSNAVCFNIGTCDYKGFICKSDLVDLASEYDNLLSRAKRIAADYDDMRSSYASLINCIDHAEDVSAARRCSTLFPMRE